MITTRFSLPERVALLPQLLRSFWSILPRIARSCDRLVLRLRRLGSAGPFSFSNSCRLPALPPRHTARDPSHIHSCTLSFQKTPLACGSGRSIEIIVCLSRARTLVASARIRFKGSRKKFSFAYLFRGSSFMAERLSLSSKRLCVLERTRVTGPMHHVDGPRVSRTRSEKAR